MEEKKLSDEEIVKAILQSIEYSKTITYFDEWGNCKSIMITDVLDLIHRLQSENETLTKENARLVNEIGGKDGWRDTVKGLTIEKFDLQKQVDELKKNAHHWKSACEHIESKTVKDTAKEIFTRIDNSFSLYYPHGQIPYSVFQERLKRLAKECYGVEVE